MAGSVYFSARRSWNSSSVSGSLRLALVLPAHLTANFEKADRQLLASYGSSPGVAALVRLWIACGTSREVQREFERAVLDIRRKTIHPPESGEFDDDCL